jgi:hypothetical protein
MICPTGKAKYFSPKGWTAFSQNSPSGKSPLARSLVEPSVAKAKGFATSALGQKADLNRRMTDARLPPTADIDQSNGDVRFVPEPDSCTAASKPCTD